MTIVLIGYRGSGKTTVGRIVAAKLGVEFVDTDALVQMRAGKTIREIFEQQGEPAFRGIEAGVLEDVLRWTDDRVVATGGGVVLREANRELLTQSGAYRYYLKSPAEVLFERINADASTASSRPALTRLGGSVEEVRTLLAQREPLYAAAATHTIDVSSLKPEVVAKMILAEVATDSGRCFPGGS
jgi:shikimate kinase